MASTVQNIKIENVSCTWEQEEVTQVTAVADVAGSLGGTYFTLASALDATLYYAWFDTGADIDPAPAGRTAIETTISANDSAATIAGLLAAAIDAVGDFGAVATGANVVITNAAVGESEDVADVDTGFAILKCANGGDTALGFVDGDIELAFDLQTLDITAQQTGTQVLAQLIQGQNVDVTMALKESDTEKLKAIFEPGGGNFTPSGGTELYGWGSSKLGSNTFVEARRLILHPLRLPAGDASEDFVFWKSYAVPGSLTLSGENPEVTNVTFRNYRDENRDSNIDIFAIGDHTQTGV
jgi:hypothetical protein